MSGGEPSSIKHFCGCAAGAPALRRSQGLRVEVPVRFWPYGHIVYLIFLYKDVSIRLISGFYYSKAVCGQFERKDVRLCTGLFTENGVRKPSTKSSVRTILPPF